MTQVDPASQPLASLHTSDPIKFYVLDTNVLLHDPQAMYKFKENDVIVPIVVIEEVDKFKKDLSELGKNARQVSRNLDKLRETGSLSAGVSLPDGGNLRVVINEDDSPIRGLAQNSNDNSLLRVAVMLKRDHPERPVLLISKDTNVRIKADALGLLAEDYDESNLSLDELYVGAQEISVPGELIDRFYQAGEAVSPVPELMPNEFLLMRNQDRPSTSALARYHGVRKLLVPVKKQREGLWGLQPRNKEQVFAFDLLVDDDIRLVTLVGKAGTGKTLLAIAAGLHKVAEEERYTRLVVSRPIFPLGRDIGYLPGDIDDKLNPWMKPIFDNVEYLIDMRRENSAGRKGPSRGHLELIEQGWLEIEPLTYIRGRSIPNQYLIIDEAQNLTPHEIKTIITRAGDGTKIVLTGDPYQIDNPYIDATNNGLTYVVERFKNQAIAGHITLVKGERSELAELAANLL
ncbi:MAG: PhoH family protein [Myxococcota bacterium]